MVSAFAATLWPKPQPERCVLPGSDVKLLPAGLRKEGLRSNTGHAPSRVYQEQLILGHVIDSSAVWSEATE